jgi:hypothetical protein
VPVDSENKIYFNAHRAFTRDYILELFDGFELLDEKYHYGTKMYENYDASKGFGTGLYMFKKENKMFKKMSFVESKLRGLALKVFNFIENNGNANFDKNGERVFIDSLLALFKNEGGRK